MPPVCFVEPSAPFTSSHRELIQHTGGCHVAADVCGHVTAAPSSRRGGIETRLLLRAASSSATAAPFTVLILLYVRFVHIIKHAFYYLEQMNEISQLGCAPL